MQTFSDRVAAKAAELIETEIERVMLIVKVANPEVIPDHATYRNFTGHVHGLEVAKGFLAEAADAVQQELRPETQKVAA